MRSSYVQSHPVLVVFPDSGVLMSNLEYLNRKKRKIPIRKFHFEELFKR
jgi:hypothetical protein